MTDARMNRPLDEQVEIFRNRRAALSMLRAQSALNGNGKQAWLDNRIMIMDVAIGAIDGLLRADQDISDLRDQVINLRKELAELRRGQS